MKENIEDAEITELIYAIDNFSKAAAGFDILLSNAVDSGVESGKMLGLLEAYDHLSSRGYTAAAKSLKSYLEKSYPPTAEAKA